MNIKRLDPRVKLFLPILFSSAALAATSLYALLSFLLMLAIILPAGGIKISYIWKKLRSLFSLIAILFVLQCLFNRKGIVLFSISNIPLVTDSGIRAAVTVSARLLIVILSSLIIATGETRDYLLSFSSLGIPYEISFMVLAAMRFLPLLREEAKDVFNAAQMRGMRIKKAGLKRQIRAYVSIIIPVVAGAISRSEQLSIAMEARGFRSMPKRTSMRHLKMKVSDRIYLATVFILVAFSFMLFLFL